MPTNPLARGRDLRSGLRGGVIDAAIIWDMALNIKSLLSPGPRVLRYPIIRIYDISIEKA
jgi:hypothetical protein